MIHNAGDSLVPFSVGTSVTNGSANIAKYNVFVIIVTITSGKVVCPFNRGYAKQEYASYTYNSSWEYLEWVQIQLSGNTFSVVGNSYSPYDGNSGALKTYSTFTIYGIA